MDAITLASQGAVVIPCLSVWELIAYRNAFYETCSRYPEYSRGSTDRVEYVLGGSGAHANPSSFHNMFVRGLRLDAMERSIALFREYDKNRGRKLAMFMHCVSEQRVGDKMARSRWHRNHVPGHTEESNEFDGWINLDHVNQFFHYAPGNYVEGYADVAALHIAKEDALDMERSGRVACIPPGHMLVYINTVAHREASVKGRQCTQLDSLRFHVAWQLTPSDEPLFDYTKVIDEQGCPVLPTGQCPYMYGPMYYNMNADRVERWSKNTFCKQALVKRWSKKDRKKRTVVFQHMPSLFEMQLRLYPAYTSEERELFQPKKRWITFQDLEKELASLSTNTIMPFVQT